MSGTPNSLNNSRIMGLKFMQRRQQQQQQQQPNSQQPPQASASTPTTSMQLDRTATAAAEWSLDPAAEVAHSATAAGRVVLEGDVAVANDEGALLKFSAGRRSFGAYNPRLEKRLAEIRASQRAAREAAAAEARAAAERRERDAEHAALVAKEAVAEAAERASELEMANAFAAKYERFVPKLAAGKEGGRDAASGPPVVNNPVRVRDAPTSKRFRSK